MDPAHYKLLHLVGVFLLFISLGSLFTKYTKAAVIGHGIALVLLLVAGMGMTAKLGYGFPGWVIAKMVIWCIFGAAIVLAKKKILQGPAAWAVMIALGTLAGYIALFKPF